MKKIIISLAPVAAGTSIDLAALVDDVKKSVELGASMCHLHCRRPDGTLTPDITFFTECFDKIRTETDVIVQASTGGVSNMTIEERCYPLNYDKVETASLNGGTTNLGDSIYINTFDDIAYCADMVYEKNILPEIEVFDIGMINNIQLTAKSHPFKDPILLNLVFGHKGGMQPNIDSLIAFRSMVPQNMLWGVTHYGRDNWDFLSAAIAMGASVVRIGFEDSNYISETEKAVYNHQLIKRLVSLIESIGYAPATVTEARNILKLKQVN